MNVVNIVMVIKMTYLLHFNYDKVSQSDGLPNQKFEKKYYSSLAQL